MSTKELRQQIQILKDAGVDTTNFEVDYHVKYSFPLSGFIFALIGVPLGMQMKRSTKATGLIISIILVFLYYVFYSLCRAIGRGGIIDPFSASWIPNIVFLALGLFLVLRVEKA
jgi:lipopolysaccharide export system permease protein